MNRQSNNYRKDFLLGDDFLTIFLPMLDDEEQRRTEELEEEEEDWDLLSDQDSDEEFDDFEEDF